MKKTKLLQILNQMGVIRYIFLYGNNIPAQYKETGGDAVISFEDSAFTEY